MTSPRYACRTPFFTGELNRRIREWGKAQGLAGERGRIASQVVEAFFVANTDALAAMDRIEPVRATVREPGDGRATPDDYAWQEAVNGGEKDAFPENIGPTREDVRALAGGLPHVFAPVQEFTDHDREGAAEVVAYGLALPGGEAATVGVTCRGFGTWRSADSTAHRLRSDPVRPGR
ncbi:hypothetical protein [Streptosporangium sp. NPDC048865]|uniref:Lsr2 family DNA-binding protein n=1 Tax=Streptosporangium sp. NPDC048865 TaxID=3155766 RepID=UPI003449017C